jgi:hypothetical protein
VPGALFEHRDGRQQQGAQLSKEHMRHTYHFAVHCVHIYTDGSPVRTLCQCAPSLVRPG